MKWIYFSKLETMNAFSGTNMHAGALMLDTSWLIISLRLSVSLNFLVLKSCFLEGSLLFVMLLTQQSEVMIHGGVFQPAEGIPETIQFFRSGLMREVGKRWGWRVAFLKSCLLVSSNWWLENTFKHWDGFIQQSTDPVGIPMSRCSFTLFRAD